MNSFSKKHKRQGRAAAYVNLAIAIFVELFAVNFLKLSAGMTEPIFSVLALLCYTLSFSLFILVLRDLPLGLSYSIWGGAGSALTLVVSCILWDEPFNLPLALGLALVIGGIIIMARADEEAEEKKASAQG